MTKRIKASITVGVTGYTGVELLRLLLAHPLVDIVHLTSRQHEDELIGKVFRILRIPTFASPAQRPKRPRKIVMLCSCACRTRQRKML